MFRQCLGYESLQRQRRTELIFTNDSRESYFTGAEELPRPYEANRSIYNRGSISRRGCEKRTS